MSLRGLAVLLLVLGAVVVALLRLRGEEEEPKEPAHDAKLLAEFAEASVRSIRATCDDTAYALARDGEGRWRLTAPVAAEADPRKVHTLVTALADARVRRVIAKEATDLASFGLAPATCSVRLDLDGDAAGRELAVGRTSPVGYERYARAGGGDVVFVDGSLHGAIARTPDALRERRLLPLDPEAVSRLEIARPDGRLVLVRSDDAWTMESPSRDAADGPESERAVRAAVALEVEGGVTPPIPSNVPPSRRIALRAGGRTAFVAAAGVEGRRLAWREDGSLAGLVPQFALQDLDRPVRAFRDRKVLSFSTPEVLRLTITRGERVLSVSRAAEGGSWSVRDGTGEDKPADGPRVDDLLGRLRDVRAAEIEDGTPAGPATGDLVIEGASGELARARWGPRAPREGEETVWVTTPRRPGVHFAVPAASFGPIPSAASELAAP